LCLLIVPVAPVADIIERIPRNVPQVLINRERLGKRNFDVSLLGECDKIVMELGRRCGWEQGAAKEFVRDDDGCWRL
jgi:hypothetical protein